MELSLGEFVPDAIAGFIAKISAIGERQDSSGLDDYVSKLEEESRKIHAFKRELPLSVLLVTAALEKLKEEDRMIRDCARKKRDEIGRVNPECDFSDKRDWMSSAQLWTSNSDFDLTPRREEEKGQDGNSGLEGGAFAGFKGRGSSSSSSSASQMTIPGLSLTTPVSCSAATKSDSVGLRGVSGSASGFLKWVAKPEQQQQQTQHGLRKQRRCWSQELHRRFVDALHQLGGSQVATPKQIRDVMQVEGLTNDEVKSHLQKYRLHVRKLPNSSTPQGNGGLRTNQPDHSEDNSMENMNNSQSSSPQGPLLGNGSSSNRALSNTGGDTSEVEDGQEDDERSDGHSWRSVSGNNLKEPKS